MASKYAGLKGQIPEQPTERDAAFNARMAQYKGLSIADLTVIYNKHNDTADDLAAKTKANNVVLDVLDVLIREQLNDLGGEAITIQGYTWSEKPEPYPVCEDPKAVVKYFNEHEMQDQLVLKPSELAARLKSFVKEESLAGQLKIETKMVPDPVTGEEQSVTEVRSQIPGVRVFLKRGLSRAKTRRS